VSNDIRYTDRMNQATDAFKAALCAQKDREARACAIRKGKTLYLVSSEARELRRIDAIYEGI
jgi:hypothetical protein